MMPEKEDVGIRYNVTLPPPVNEALERAADQLHVSKAEAIRRALTLFAHAVESDKVELTKHGERQTVLIK